MYGLYIKILGVQFNDQASSRARCLYVCLVEAEKSNYIYLHMVSLLLLPS